jgi:hypothetical protein
MDSKLKEIRDLINEKERIDNRLAVLLGETEAPKRGRPRKETNGGPSDVRPQSPSAPEGAASEG